MKGGLKEFGWNSLKNARSIKEKEDNTLMKMKSVMQTTNSCHWVSVPKTRNGKKNLIKRRMILQSI